MTTTSPLPAGTVGTSYTQTFTATGGTTPYTWSRESGSLPGGLTFTAGGTLSGTPTAAGSFNFTIRVRDNSAVRQTVDKAFALTISSPVPLAISTGSTLPAGTVGTSYSQTLAATGGTTPYTWSRESGSLPGGLIFYGGRHVSGTPTAEGSFSFTIRVTDSGAPTECAEGLQPDHRFCGSRSQPTQLFPPESWERLTPKLWRQPAGQLRIPGH